MEKGRGWTVIAGIIIGIVLGAFFYIFPAKFLACGSLPLTSLFIPMESYKDLLKMTFIYGALPGVFFGLTAGAGVPIVSPEGYLSKCIGAPTWLIATILAWITQWKHLSSMSVGRIIITVLITIFSFYLSLPVSHIIGGSIEKIIRK
jgi:hypothetical protein